MTKDEDFVLLKMSEAEGPTVVWIRIGNVRRVLLQRISSVWAEVVSKLEAGETIIEVR